MRVLKLFRDIGMDYRWTESKNYEVVIRTKVGQEGICRLLGEELVPSIPYRVDVGCLIVFVDFYCRDTVSLSR